MEGLYTYTTGLLTGDQISAIRGEKEKIGILSLSKEKMNQLMWAHYAEGHAGIVIGVEVDDTKYEVRDVDYGGLSSIISPPSHSPYNIALNILSKKLDFWAYEKEARVFTKGGTKFVNIQIKEVIFGSKMKKEDVKFYEKLFAQMRPDVTFEQSTIGRF